MAKSRKKRNQFEFLTKKFPLRMQRKLVMLFMAIILAFLVLIGRITFINATKGSSYTKIVLDQQDYGSRTIPYKRGDIVDRNGTKLATSERVYNVILDVKVTTSKDDYLEPTIKALVDCFGLDETKVRAVIQENPESHYQILTKGISYEKAQEFEAIEADTEKYPNVKGIWLEEDYTRTYPYGSLASDVIGFTVSGNQGAIGIESAYNDILNGTDGREYGYFDNSSSMERTVKVAKDGQTTVSTIDVTLSSIVAQCIKEFNVEYADEDSLGSKNTAVIIMNPNTGEILAEESYPNFDLNNPRNLTGLYTDEEIEAMSDEEEVDALNALWRNFCVSDTFEPGSTAKPFTVAAGLETGALTGDETYVCGGYLHVGDDDVYCHLKTGHGTETVEDAIADSCNVALMDMAEAIGVEKFCKYQRVFGFGSYTGIDLPGEAATSALLHTTETMQPVDLATSSFGQSFNVTMTQMASAFCSLINGGYYYEPHVVKQIQDENGKVVETKDPVLLRKTISAETSEMLKQYLRAVVTKGTGQGAAVEGYEIGGKTGTAEKLPRGEERYVLSFIGYAPQENPEVVIYVVIDEPNVDDQDNSNYVLGLSQKIMSQAFPYLGITTMDGYTATTSGTMTDEEAAAATAAASQSQKYTDFDEAYEDTYSNSDGPYTDENYQPDLDDWATGQTPEE